MIDDPAFAPNGERATRRRTRRVLLCSGKVYYTLLEAREDSGFEDVAIVRVEELHPFPFDQLVPRARALRARATSPGSRKSRGTWARWQFVQERLRRVLPADKSLRYVGRRESASPATGSYRLHEEEQAEFVREAFAPKAMARREGA